jgi:ectoine hydroxylase-related dioxygenase (phytanoyl-CoA dioxygenase family)
MSDRLKAWKDDGFFFLRGLYTPAEVAAIEAEIIGRLRADPPAAHPHERSYRAGEHYLIQPETEPSPTARNAEDFVAKVFNCHAEGRCLDLARGERAASVVAELIGEDIDCFQSQFIFKNPGVIGQPWHQDSYYFKFDRQPQVGVWVALSRATLENGCLWVVPGSHAGPIHPHEPDSRPGANGGYREVMGVAEDRAVPALMEPGDVLVFHSYLLHKSTDNVADYRRSALVLHYGVAGTRAVDPAVDAALAHVNRWVPVRRARETATV